MSHLHLLLTHSPNLPQTHSHNTHSHKTHYYHIPHRTLPSHLPGMKNLEKDKCCLLHGIHVYTTKLIDRKRRRVPPKSNKTKTYKSRTLDVQLCKMGWCVEVLLWHAYSIQCPNSYTCTWTSTCTCKLTHNPRLGKYVYICIYIHAYTHLENSKQEQMLSKKQK